MIKLDLVIYDNNKIKFNYNRLMQKVNFPVAKYNKHMINLLISTLTNIMKVNCYK